MMEVCPYQNFSLKEDDSDILIEGIDIEPILFKNFKIEKKNYFNVCSYFQ